MDADQIVGIINQPIDVLVVLAAGYIGYKVAYTGKNKQHKPVDVIFISLAFGLFAQIFYGISNVALSQLVNVGVRQLSAAITILAALLVASFWRRYLEGWVRTLLRATDVSFSDGYLTALDTINASTKFRPTQLVVWRTDGSQVMCDYLHPFENKPFGPCIIGEDGSVALYVNNIKYDKRDDWREVDPCDEHFGCAITYVPASQIANIQVRYLS